MALRTPPSWLQNGSHSAENDRLTTQALWGRTGVGKTGDLIVTASSGMVLSVSSGWAIILGTYATNQGAYIAYNDAAASVTITTANPTLSRIDLVCVTVSDSAYTGTTNTVAFNVVAGTPAASPTVPSTPINSIALAQVAVGAGVTTISSGNITDKRVRAAIQEAAFTSSSTATTPVRIELNASQTANALSIVNSSGTVVNGFDNAGNLLVGGTNQASIEVEIIMGAY
jgi:hypothetical protein